MPHIKIYRLRNAQRDLAREIRGELRRPHPDPGRIAELQRRKQAVAERLARLERGLSPFGL